MREVDMPVTIQTMISDLFSNRSRGVRGLTWVAGQGALEEGATLHPTYRVREAATPITLAVGGAPEFFFNADRAPKQTANGYCLCFEDKWSTVAMLTREHRIVVGGGYSGCLYSVYHAGGGVYMCVHTARPSDGLNADRYVALLRHYAQDQGWTLVHEVPTANDGVSGAGINGCVTTSFATRVGYTVWPNTVVQTVRLRENAQGLSVRRDRWETPTP
jgi:hypothetical protein